MKHKFDLHLPPKVILMILAGIAIIIMILTSIFSNRVPVLGTVAEDVFVPMEKGINSCGVWFEGKLEDIRDTRKLRSENKSLNNKVKQLQKQVDSQRSDQAELSNLRKLYALDQKYASYSKTGARIIATGSSNWYNTFTIDKGYKDGIRVDMNVIADEGLVGIVYSVSEKSARVRSIIDDTSYVSGMFSTTGDNCIVNGSLKNIENGYITVDHLSKDAKVSEGDEIVTSNVSSKFLPGISIGYVSDLKKDDNSLTMTGRVTPVVDFRHLEEVLVITEIKDTGADDKPVEVSSDAVENDDEAETASEDAESGD